MSSIRRVHSGVIRTRVNIHFVSRRLIPIILFPIHIASLTSLVTLIEDMTIALRAHFVLHRAYK